MKYPNIVRFTVAALLTLLLSAPLLAQQSREAGRVRERVTREINGRAVTVERPIMLEATEANFEQYRSDLLVILAAQIETSKVMHLDVVGKLESAREQALALKFSDFPEQSHGFVDLSSLKDGVTRQKDLITKAYASKKESVSQLATTTLPITHPNDVPAVYTFNIPSDPFPGAVYSGNICPLNIPDGQPAEVAYAAGIVLLAAELVRDLAQDACNETILAFVFGGNFRLVCLIPDAIYAAAKVAFYVTDWCCRDTVYAQTRGGYLAANYVKDQLVFSINNDDANKAMLSTQLTNAENHIVTNGNNNKAALSTQLGSFQTLTVRSAIERNMAADPTTVAAVGLFQLPASRGGYLEVVRQILIDTYNAQVAAAGAGVTVYNPSTELSTGATLTSQGKYREAYYYYRKAFRLVVKYP